MKNQDYAGNSRVRLTEKEIAILSLYAQDIKREQISMLLNISIDTVKDHQKRIRRKTGIRSRSALVKLAMELGVD